MSNEACGRLATIQIGMTADPTRGGGLDRYFYSLLKALPSAGVVSSGLVIGDPDSLPDPIAGVSSFAPVGAGLLSRWSRLRKLLPKALQTADLVVSHFAPYAFPVLDIVARRPFVVHFHGPWAGEGRMEGDSRLKFAIKATLEKIVYRRAGAFIVLSQAFADVLSREYGIDRKKITIVPGGVDIARFTSTKSKDEIRARLDWPLDRRIVLSVRRLVHAKGIEDLIASAEAVRRDVPDVLYLIAGTGPLAADLAALVRKKDLGSHVKLIGFLSEADLPDAYRAADLFVVPTIALEGFGLVVVEALASGTPAMVTPIGGLPEVVRDLSADLIFRDVGSVALTSGIREALTGETKLPSQSECIAYAQRFDWNIIAQRVAAIYRGALV